MRILNTSHREPSCPTPGRGGLGEAQALPCPKRILLVSRNVRLLNALTRRLCNLGHRVCTIMSEEQGPTAWSPRLYDVVVFSADDAPAMLNGVCEAARKADSKLLLVMLAREPFGIARGVPDVVITDSEEPAIAEKLLAVVNGSVLDAA